MKRTLPIDSEARKNIPLFSGCIKYFAAALAGVARWSKVGNDKHNPGEPMHHARGKSMDHADCILRHLMDIADLEAYFERNPHLEGAASDDFDMRILDEADALAWRSLALSQQLHEKYGGAPLAPGARLDSMRAELTVQIDASGFRKELEEALRKELEGALAAPIPVAVDWPEGLDLHRTTPLHQRAPGPCECGDPTCTWPAPKAPTRQPEDC